MTRCINFCLLCVGALYDPVMQGSSVTAVHHYRTVLEAFGQGGQTPRHGQVELKSELSLNDGGSIVASMGHFLVWEAWGALNQQTIASSLLAMRDEAARAAAQGLRLTGLFDHTRVEIFEDSAQQLLIDWRQQLSGSLAFDRTAIVFGGSMSRITYSMATLLQPSPWEERVFPTVDEALIWVQDPVNTLLIDVDGLSWIV